MKARPSASARARDASDGASSRRYAGGGRGQCLGIRHFVEGHRMSVPTCRSRRCVHRVWAYHKVSLVGLADSRVSYCLKFDIPADHRFRFGRKRNRLITWAYPTDKGNLHVANIRVAAEARTTNSARLRNRQ